MKSRVAGLALMGALLATAPIGAGLVHAETRIVGNLAVTVSAQLSPKKLPRQGRAPVAVSIGWKIATTDGAHVPTLKTLKLEINRNGVLDLAGLPVCPYAKIQPASTKRALTNCRPALVGRGSFSALVGLKGQEGYVSKGQMVVFNGKKGGKPVLYGQIYSAHPFANSFVVVFEVNERRHGTYGTTLTAKLPAGLRAWGNLTEINMRLSRKFAYRGAQRSFLSASCPAPKGFKRVFFALARATFQFDDHAGMTQVLSETCTARD